MEALVFALGFFCGLSPFLVIALGALAITLV